MDDLESRLAFQDDLIEGLNEVVAKQDRELLDLKQRLVSVEMRLRDLAEAAPAVGDSGAHDVPPHY